MDVKQVSSLVDGVIIPIAAVVVWLLICVVILRECEKGDSDGNGDKTSDT